MVGDFEFFPALFAAIHGKLSILRYILSLGVPANMVTPASRKTALHCASIQPDEAKMLPVVNSLVEEYDCDIRIEDCTDEGCRFSPAVWEPQN